MYEYRTLESGNATCNYVHSLPDTSEYDVVIIGGGTAGCIAACYLADKKKKVLIIEKQNFLGGMYASGMYEYYTGSSGGLYESFDKQITDFYNQHRICPSYGSQPFCRKYFFENYLLEKGVKISFDSMIIGIYKKNREIVAIQFLKSSEIDVIKTKMIIDASADASLCKIAGAKTFIGRSSDNLCQPFSNVRIYYDRQSKMIKINNIDAGYLSFNDRNKYSNSVLESFNNPYYSMLNHNEVTLGMSNILGVRESNRIDGLSKITMRQVLNGYEDDEPLFYTTSNIDNHAKDIAFESEPVCDWIVAFGLWSTLISIPVNKRHLIPKEFDNVIVAGRNISVDHDISTQTRMMRDCQKCGEAAGIIINTSLEQHRYPKEIPYELLCDELMENHCLYENNHIGLKDNPPLNTKELMQMPTSIHEIKNMLSSDRPGFGMLVAFRKKILHELKEWVLSQNENLQFNSAIVLALLENDSGYEILLKHARHRNPYLPKTSKSYSTLRGISAIYAIGKLKKKDAIFELMQILQQESTFKSDEITFDKFISSIEDYHFQYVSHLIRAILNIAIIYKDFETMNQIQRIIANDDFTIQCTLKSNPNELYDMKNNLVAYVQWRLNSKEREDQ